MTVDAADERLAAAPDAWEDKLHELAELNALMALDVAMGHKASYWLHFAAKWQLKAQLNGGSDEQERTS